MRSLDLVGAGRTWGVKTQGHSELTLAAFQERGCHYIHFPSYLSDPSVRENKLGNLWMRGGEKGQRGEREQKNKIPYTGKKTTC